MMANGTRVAKPHSDRLFHVHWPRIILSNLQQLLTHHPIFLNSDVALFYLYYIPSVLCSILQGDMSLQLFAAFTAIIHVS